MRPHEDVINTIWKLSESPEKYSEALKNLTSNLIDGLNQKNRLLEDPLKETRNRKIHLYEDEIKAKLLGKIILITGEGCIGSLLVKKLLKFGCCKRIIIVDSSGVCKSEDFEVKRYSLDIRDCKTLRSVFQKEMPNIVFHTAGQRNPGLAEKEIRRTITTNIFGSQNIISFCQEFGVEQCVFSSTGKASRYFTNEVYAGSKKFAEWLFYLAAKQGKTTYSMVRFTHILDNSLMEQELQKSIDEDKPVGVHSPGRYVTAQTAEEAVFLMLNSLVFSQKDELRFLIVRNLGWPTESLEVALWKIKESKKKLPLYFKGKPQGYTEPFFRGQLDWSDPMDMNFLINALETPSKFIDASGDIIISALTPVREELVESKLNFLISNIDLSEDNLKSVLTECIKEIAKVSFIDADPLRILQILKWGIDRKYMEVENISLIDYSPLIGMLTQALVGKPNFEEIMKNHVSASEFSQIIATLKNSESFLTV
ncbi:MAG: polysaccharide biosynthesis protein [Nostoc sp.]